MTKFFSYMFAGVLVSSLAVFACSSDTTSGDDDDDDDTTSSSSSGGKSSSSSSSGGKSSSSSSSSGGSSSSSGSSSGGQQSDVTLSDFALDPLTGTVGTEGTYTWSFTVTGEVPEGAGLGVVVTQAPDGVTQEQMEAALGDGDAPTIDADNKASGSLTFTPPAAGNYKFAAGFQASQSADPVFSEETLTVVVSE